MKTAIIKLIMICALATSNMWATFVTMPTLWICIENRENGLSFQKDIKTYLLDQPTKIARNHFGLKEGEFHYYWNDKRVGHTIVVSSAKFHELVGVQKYDMQQILENLKDGHSVATSCLEIDRRLQGVKGWAATEYGKDMLDKAIHNYFSESLDPNNMAIELAKIDEIARTIEGARSDQLNEESKNVWKSIAAHLDTYFQKQVTRIIDGSLIAYNLSSGAVINDVTSRDVQFLKYALEHARKDSEQKSLIIGPWFDDKIEHLREDELENIITHLKQWTVHYQSVENNFAHMLAQKQQGWQKIASSLVRNGALKKASVGALLIGVGFAASQLYHYVCNTPANEQPENVQA